MNVLPRILFYMQMLPIPKTFFVHVSNMLTTFIWKLRKPQITMKVLQHHKRYRGLGVPDVRRYYQAIALQRILNWRFLDRSKLWVTLQEQRGLSEATSPLTNSTLRTRDRINRALSLPPHVPAGAAGRVPLVPTGGTSELLWSLGR